MPAQQATRFRLSFFKVVLTTISRDDWREGRSLVASFAGKTRACTAAVTFPGSRFEAVSVVLALDTGGDARTAVAGAVGVAGAVAVAGAAVAIATAVTTSPAAQLLCELENRAFGHASVLPLLAGYVRLLSLLRLFRFLDLGERRKEVRIK